MKLSRRALLCQFLLRAAACLVALSGVWQAAQAAQLQSNQLEELTWTEVRDRVAAGSTTVLIPIGATEQNGPHMVLGKHNVRVRFLADQIARQLGTALVAPVVAYVPEGSIHPPAAHMRFSGTISIPEATFEALLEATARSFKQHGFRSVVFLGDHGGYQKNEERVAAKLNREWLADPSCRVHALVEYYRVTQTAYVATLRSAGYSDAEIGQHAGLADTSLALAVDKSLVRSAAFAGTANASGRDGVVGDPHRASAELGQLGLQQIIQTSVAAIQALNVNSARPSQPRN
jgi:creatinine amidohydrolase/Fe(II)-dependent formamide hydrolase-like protein